jgi:flagellar basal-body rod protein FlgF
MNFLGKFELWQFGRVRANWLSKVMDQVSITAASGLQSRMEALDMVANNLANTTTGGFKLDREFYSLFTAAENEGDDEAASTKLPLIQKQWTDFSQGVLAPTGNPLDVALSGKGFFTVNGPAGPLYTRNGSFQLSPSGQLTTSEGYAVRDTNGQPIQTQSQDPLEITPDGSITQSGQTIGQLQVVNFQDPSTLQKMGNSYFLPSDPKNVPTAAADTTVVQGKTENSNVAPAESAVRLVGLMRQFEMLQKAITITSDMNKQALTEVAKVGG